MYSWLVFQNPVTITCNPLVVKITYINMLHNSPVALSRVLFSTACIVDNVFSQAVYNNKMTMYVHS